MGQKGTTPDVIMSLHRRPNLASPAGNGSEGPARGRETILEYTVVGLVVVAGLVLRLWGISFGLPYLYNPDEPKFVSHACRILQNLDPNPHWFGAPATTTIYMLSFLYGLIFLTAQAWGTVGSVEFFRALYFRDPTLFYLSGRLMSTLFALATILLVHGVSRRLFDRKTGLLAAALLALSPVHVLHSKLIRMDIQMGFLIVAAFWFCLNLLEKGDWMDYLLAGLLTGLAVVTKYPAVVFAVTIALAHFASTPRFTHLRDHWRLLGSGAACVAGAFLGSPFLLLDFRTALSDLRIEARPTHLSGTGEGLIRNFAWYVGGPLPNALSIVGLVFAGLGFLLCFASREKGRRLLLTFPLFFLLFISSLSLRWERWVVPAIPFLCIPLAHAVYEVAGRVRWRLNPQLELCVGLVLFLTIPAPLLKAAVSQGREMSGMDTRTLARQWMIDHIPAGSRVLAEIYAPQLPKRLYRFFEINAGVLIEVDVEKMNHETFRPSGHLGRIRDVQDVRRQNIEYMVISNMYDRYLAERERYPEIVATYEMLMRSGTLIYEVQGAPGVNTGPRIRIYELDRSGK